MTPSYAPKTVYTYGVRAPEPIKVRENLLRLESEMRRMEQVDIAVTHHFAPGAYAREIFIPKGVTLVGKLHKTSFLCIISKGRVHVVTEHGKEVYEAPYTFVSPVGAKRAIYAEEDTVFTTFHVTEETDVGKIEETIIAKSYDDLPALDESAEPLKLKEI
jgi:hypothetical protein